ncbi:MAG: phosphate regulon transcriptional regulatory protein PhoB [Cycloclasticus sp.]|nr:phosphate regulon transcriptional regulatory protein PhoB [Cycloclasticus sp.]MBG96561.1 phosphate regulon transcriptional regulatory protein PhoB [Cycloclasticus sp.]HAI96852.1 phosphate regulon transcriptional regulatory protein PhoB [Methylococcaceae bacterium]|tara:strand:- start:1617 stop:2312 length:696 start_codon:yes stop_codon:yes gene_type:complete
MEKMNVLLVEDDEDIGEMLQLSLSSNQIEVIWCTDVMKAQESLRDSTPDIILLDWMLPGISGPDWVKFLKNQEENKRIPIIMLTARSAEDDKISGLDTGADDYVTKPFSVQELIARMKAVLRRSGAKTDTEVISIGPLFIEPNSHRVALNNIDVMMSPTEYKLLYFFASNPNKVFSRNQLLDNVWGDNVYVEDRTVDVHIRRLRRILDAQGCADLVQTVRGFGYKLVDPTP